MPRSAGTREGRTRIRSGILLGIAIGVAAFSILPSGAGADPTTGVPLGHPVYRWIERFEARGWVRGWGNGTRPMSRMEVARLLRQVLDRSAREGGLSRAEGTWVERLKVEFAPELRMMGVPLPAEPRSIPDRIRRGGHLKAWTGAEGDLALDLLFRQRFLKTGGERISQTHVGGSAEGTAGRLIGFRLRHWEARQQGNRTVRSRADVVGDRVEFLEAKGKTADFREATGEMVAGTPWLDVAVGKDFASWGPSFTGGLMLSDQAPSYPFVKMRARYGRLKFVHMMGFLRSGLTDTARTIRDNGSARTFERRKYLSAHRLEIGISPGITLGLQELVIYGDRGVEFAYAIPASLLLATQSYLGDKDNAAVGLDVSACVVRNLKLYAAVFLDDLTKFQGPGAFSNKFALQAGLLWVDPAGWKDAEVRGEYVRIEPWVYTHLFDINRYQHYGATLGHPLGPNSDGLYGEIRHRITASLSLAAQGSRERHGANPVLPDGTIRNVGGDAAVGQRPGDEAGGKRFLDGVRERRTRLGWAVSFEPTGDLALEAGYLRLTSDIAGVRGAANEWSATLRYRFY